MGATITRTFIERVPQSFQDLHRQWWQRKHSGGSTLLGRSVSGGILSAPPPQPDDFRRVIDCVWCWKAGAIKDAWCENYPEEWAEVQQRLKLEGKPW